MYFALNLVLVAAFSWEFGFASSIGVLVAFELGSMYMTQRSFREALNTPDFVIVDLERRRITTPEKINLPDKVVIIRDDDVFEFTRDLGINVITRGEA
jgi:hypothetical protein